MNSIMNSMTKRIAMSGLLLAACTVYLAMQLSPASAASVVNPPGTVTTWGGGTSTPTPVVFPAGVVPVSISAYETEGGLAITQDGSLYEWSGVTNVVPAKVTFPPAVTRVQAVSIRFPLPVSNYQFPLDSASGGTLALTNDGVYAWAGNGSSTPAKVVFPPAVTSVSAIAAGYSHSLAITNDGLYAWGDNSQGELGLGAYRFTSGYIYGSSVPVKVLLPATVTMVSKIAAGLDTSYAITNDGLYSWGGNFYGQLGWGVPGIDGRDSGTDLGQPLPGKVLFSVVVNKGSKVTVTSVTEITAGQDYALAITNDGLYGWGDNVYGQLGTSTTFGDTVLPVKVNFPTLVTTITAIATVAAVGRDPIHSLAVTNNGLYAWGDNSVGQLGIFKKSYELTPTKVPGEDNAIGVAAATFSSLAIH